MLFLNKRSNLLKNSGLTKDSIMRYVPIDEEDEDLFGSYLNETLCDVYYNNIGHFNRMWREQGTGYWLKFCITLRSVVQNEGQPGLLLTDPGVSYSEDFFVQLTDILAGSHAEEVHKMIQNVVALSRASHLLQNVGGILMGYPVTLTKPFIQLFCPNDAFMFEKFPKMYCQLPLYLRAVGCLMKLLQRWMIAVPMNTKEKILWKQPKNWFQTIPEQTGAFEHHLKQKWSSNLSLLLGVQTANIVWWNKRLNPVKPIMLKERTSLLGNVIEKECKIIDQVERPGSPHMVYFLISSMPRCKWITTGDLAVGVAFMCTFIRGLYLVDDLAAFHPYSQASIQFYNYAFGPNFWYGKDGLENLYKEWIKGSKGYTLYSSSKKTELMREAVYFVIGNAIAAHNVISLESRFFDTLYDGTTWSSTVTLIRLPWNMPLCINWMEVLLIKVYEFGQYLKPLRHFPLKKKLHSLMQNLIYKIEEAAVLAKAAIILAMKIHQCQDLDLSMCYHLRALLPDIIEKLGNVMKFLDRDAYQILNVIFRNGWTSEERDTGKFLSGDRDRTEVDLDILNSLPDVDRYFTKDFRSINYWFGLESMENIENGRKYAEKVAKVIKDFKSEMADKDTKKSDYDFAAYTKYAKRYMMQEDVQSLEMINLLIEDGWVSPAEENWRVICKQVSRLKEFKQFGTTYFVAALLLGELWDCKISGQNALARLHRAECLAVMTDSGLKLRAMIQIKSTSTAIPSTQFFKDGLREIQNRGADSDITVEDALAIMKLTDEVTSTKLEMSNMESLTEIDVPTDAEANDAAFVKEWLNCFEKKRVQLLQLISDEQFRFTSLCHEKQNASSKQCFPHNDVLEYRLVEEAAALRKCLVMDNLKPGTINNLMKLLAHRINWIQNTYIAWKEKKHFGKHGKKRNVYGSEQLQKVSCKGLIQARSVAMRASAIFSTTICALGSTHPLSQLNLKMMVDQAVALYKFASKRCTLGMTIRNPSGGGPRCSEYCDGVLKMVAYCDQLIHHCREVWNIPIFYCDPRKNVRFGSAAHAELIITAFDWFHLMFVFMATEKVNHTVVAKLEILTVYVREAMDTLISMVVDGSHSYQEKIAGLKAKLRQIWSEILTLKKTMHLDEKLILDFFGNEHPEWMELFKLFCTGKHNTVLEKLAVSEFINSKELQWISAPLNQKKTKEKKDEARKKSEEEIILEMIKLRIEAYWNKYNDENKHELSS